MLAATLGATYGIYGPPFEQCVGTPLRQGSEEYLDSEKYQVTPLGPRRAREPRATYIARINDIRRENPALHYDRNLRFFEIDNDEIICYGKSTPDLSNTLIIIVNLDPYHTQSGWVRLPIAELAWAPARPGIPGSRTDQRRAFPLARATNYVQLDPKVNPVHILRVRRKIHTEQDFDYFM